MREEREERESCRKEREKEREGKYGVFRNELGFKGDGYWV